MKGLVLAAGAGNRLRPHTNEVPKALVPVRDGLTILDVTLRNFCAVGITDATIVVGYRAEAIEARLESLASRSGVRLDVVHNDRAEEWNNAYSLWCARDHLGDDVVLANGDTLHPAAVETLLLNGSRLNITLAIDDQKTLGDEEMKVDLETDGTVRTISKSLAHRSAGEYIGVAVLPASRSSVLIDALERTWRADPGRYYEDAFQLLADEGEPVHTQPIGALSWIEVDDERDLRRAREMACHF